ncbi:hypothetical protein [Planomonospora sp. ID82291]|uniref:hypothetical protein n=1 Tax=Planomonospora sp. ID82291 TaxID=2738136 RepID=UPI0018C353FB|nr:hypothetical protein [Planomonospora sp. ID82291]MBG0815049.1 hypothetical protein [Planomonospora sp. ID82291]
MSVPDLFRNVAGKAKELPLYVLQTTLSGVGQALMLGDRVRGRIKRMAGGADDLDQERPAASEQAAGTGEQAGTAGTAEERPARREPVIFAPAKPKPAPETGPETGPETETATAAPAQTGTSPTEPEAVEPAGSEPTEPESGSEPTEPESGSEPTEPESGSEPTEPESGSEPTEPESGSNGGRTRPAPVVFAPAPTAAEPAPEPVIAVPPAVKVEVAEVEVEVETPDAAGAAPVEAEVEVVKTKPAEPELAASATTRAKAAKAKVRKEAAGPAPVKAARTAKTVAPAAEPGTAAPATAGEDVPAEPLPGYSGLTVASLRARMRGKSAQQIRIMIAYEQATTARPEVVRMYENRLAKLEAAE